MDEMLRFFMELLNMTTSMVDDIMPDMLLHLDEGTLENLMALSQTANTSLQVFIKLCDLISRRKLSRPSSNLAPEQGLVKETSAVDVQQSQPTQSSSVGDNDNKSIVRNFSDLTSHDDDLWKVLLTDARIWYSTHNKDQIPEVYYCGVCNKRAKAKHIWVAHLGGKTHMKLLEDVDAVKFVCGTCGLQLCGDYELINIIIASGEHHAFDALVCDNSQASPGHSTTSVGSGKDNSKQHKAELSHKSEPSDMKPIISAPPSTNSDPTVISQVPNPIVQSTSKVSKVVFQNTEIHTDFVNVTDVIAGYIEDHQAYAIGYCRPCEVICESKLQWNAHKCTPKHRGKMISKHYKNVLCRCLQCEFVVTAGLKIAVTYMKYHIEYCHHQSTDGIKTEEYMEVKNLSVEANKREAGSKASSFKRSTETVYSVSSSVVDLSDSLADLRSSSADSLYDLNGVSASCACSPEIPEDVNSRDPGQHADQQVSATSGLTIGTTKKTRANPYRSSNTRAPSEQVSDLDQLSAKINSPPAQNDDLPAQNYESLL